VPPPASTLVENPPAAYCPSRARFAAFTPSPTVSLPPPPLPLSAGKARQAADQVGEVDHVAPVHAGDRAGEAGRGVQLQHSGRAGREADLRVCRAAELDAAAIADQRRVAATTSPRLSIQAKSCCT
jgi:hypothetical protein